MVEEEFEDIDFGTNRDIIYNSPFAIKELNSILKSLKSSSPGEDSIHNEFLLHLSHSHKEKLLKFYNEILKEQKFPNSWKQASLIPIVKPGKPPTDCTSYRPIALLSCLSKVLEKLINIRLNTYLDTNNIINENQFGFRKGLSTIDALAFIENEIRETYLRGEYMIAIFLDIQKAYDTVWHQGLLKKLHNIGLRGKLPNLIKDFLINRHISIYNGSTTSNLFEVQAGLPQGSVLSPTLFNIFINDLFSECTSSINYLMYADDCVLWCKNYVLKDGIDFLQDSLEDISRWSETWGLNFPPPENSGLYLYKKESPCGLCNFISE